MNTSLLSKIILSIALFFVSISVAHAQSSTIQLSTNPASPGPYETVFVTVSSATIDLTEAEITWYRDGELRGTYVGQSTVQFKAGPAGASSRVEVVVTTPEGREHRDALTVTPIGLNVIWEGQTYTPPLYEGRALVSSGSLVSLVAMPEFVDSQGNFVPPSQLQYTWQQSGVTLSQASGIGKQRATLAAPTSVGSTLVVDLIVSTQDGRVSRTTRTTISTKDTKGVIYEETLSEGVLYQKAYTSIGRFSKDVVLLRVVPYYFSIDDVLTNNITYDWDVSGIKISGTKNARTIELDSEGVDGIVDVDVDIFNKNLPMRVFQEAFLKLRVLFE